MEQDELTTVLQDAGLSPYQAEAYVTLLELGSASATDLADLSQVPDPRIYDVLRDLESKGFIETYEQDSLHARAHDPDEVLADLRSRASKFESAASEIEERWSQPEVGQSKVSIVSRFETVIDSAKRYIGDADNQVQLAVTPTQFEALRPALVDAIDRGVLVKLSLHSAGRDEVDLNTVSGACTEARHRPLPSPFVVIVDRKQTCFAPHSDSINQYGVLVDDRSHTYVFHWFFLTSLWDVWEPLYTAYDEDRPDSYVNLRYFVRDVKPMFDNGAEISLEIVGVDTLTGRSRTVRGELVDISTTNEFDQIDREQTSPPSVAEFAGVAAVSVDTGDEVISVGGWGATMEDVEAERITVTSFDSE
ncbi:TrmB family transcriptional regulator [Natranaeroarchaeum sulfidigenes]|uniref:Sugar-specific transcriptional regulator TrmB n=1 Tax=Natranaeroarchaeum sulfidigenes TaxID=2784880 RepID=A0A897MQY9_9EURY|nr:TrmB family transcriptional regulator sugar-binding domain-containing protein [Natranaeroarchaeum sulfidigenes]QSG02741.1 Sugar-specific transcriptional regulator TrmB [Natranaeroarchaeum sulfidigenes]